MWRKIRIFGSETYSTKQFDGYKLRAKVEMFVKTSDDIHTIDIYTTETVKDRV
jgi:hypothetical protein